MPCTIRLSEVGLPLWFELTAPWLQSMADGSGGRFLVSDIEGGIERRQFQLWPILLAGECVAAVVTELVEYPRLRACRLIGCAGRDMRAWLELHSAIVAWATLQGCTRMEALARPGWARVLEPCGYRSFHVLLESDINAPPA